MWLSQDTSPPLPTPPPTPSQPHWPPSLNPWVPGLRTFACALSSAWSTLSASGQLAPPHSAGPPQRSLSQTGRRPLCYSSPAPYSTDISSFLCPNTVGLPNVSMCSFPHCPSMCPGVGAPAQNTAWHLAGASTNVC